MLYLRAEVPKKPVDKPTSSTTDKKKEVKKEESSSEESSDEEEEERKAPNQLLMEVSLNFRLRMEL